MQPGSHIQPGIVDQSGEGDYPEIYNPQSQIVSDGRNLVQEAGGPQALALQ